MFGFESGKTKSLKSKEDAAYLVVTIKKNGVVVKDSYQMSFFYSGNSYSSDPLFLEEGEYQLTKFLVLNGTNKTIYKTPLETETELAEFVNDPLPINFTVAAKPVTIVPQVIPYNDPIISGDRAFDFTIITPIQLNLKVFLEGLYNKVNKELNRCYNLTNTGGVYDYFPNFKGNVVDTITIELHNENDYSKTVYAVHGIELNPNGTANTKGLNYVAIPPKYNGKYYITIKTRNHIETTTKSAVSLFTAPIDYDFTNAINKAYGDNLKLVGNNVYAIYVGDIDQNGQINSVDLSTVLSVANTPNPYGYNICDLDGDSYIDVTDIDLVKGNLMNGVHRIIPPQ